MKAGSSITELAAKLQSIRDNARDLIVPAEHLSKISAVLVNSQQPPLKMKDIADMNEAELAAELKAPAASVAIQVQNHELHTLAPSPWAHSQLSEYADIPREYYKRVLGENPGLLASSLNHGFAMQAAIAAGKRQGSGGKMLRRHGNDLRAVVSTSYRTLDNYDLFEAIAPSLIELGFEPESMELTDKRMYLKVLSPKIQSEIKKGDVVQYGLVVSNSDVGAGSVRVEPLIYRLVCLNGMITSTAIRKAHLGRNIAGNDIEEMFQADTNRVTDQAFWMQVRDVVQSTAKPEFFEREVNRLREAANVALVNFNLPEVIERAAREARVTLSGAVKESILDNLARGADGAGMNKWGLANAFTFAAGNVESLSYDDATDLERAGSKIIELSPKSWEVINAK